MKNSRNSIKRQITQLKNSQENSIDGPSVMIYEWLINTRRDAQHNLVIREIQIKW